MVGRELNLEEIIDKINENLDYLITLVKEHFKSENKRLFFTFHKFFE